MSDIDRLMLRRQIAQLDRDLAEQQIRVDRCGEAVRNTVALYADPSEINLALVRAAVDDLDAACRKWMTMRADIKRLRENLAT